VSSVAIGFVLHVPIFLHDALPICGVIHGFTVPAINVRGMAYVTARSIFRTAIRLDAGAFIFEIARSEIAYTEQRPAEYVAVMLEIGRGHVLTPVTLETRMPSSAGK